MSVHHTTKPESGTHRVLALYKFVSPKFDSPELYELRSFLLSTCLSHSARGTLLLSTEGINGTICYPYPDNTSCDEEEEDLLLASIQEKFGKLRIRISTATKNVFYRLKVKIKSEIISLGTPVDPTEVVGTYVNPGPDWDALLNDPECLVVDTRNEYEVRVGTFKGAVNPHTDNFTEFPDFLKQEGASAAKRIAMFCTGGIRCEKSTSLAKKLYPDKEVYHLAGGILGYLDAKKEGNESMFEGECYVFDQRVAVGHGLQPTKDIEPCFACRQPLTVKEREDASYEAGISCPYCVQELTNVRRERLAQRNRQIEIAEKDGFSHLHDKKYDCSIQN